MVTMLSLVLALRYIQPIVERNRLMLAWLHQALLSDEPHRFYQTPLTDTTIFEFSALAGQFDALCQSSPDKDAPVCWRAEMAHLTAGGAQPDWSLQPAGSYTDARQMMLAHVAGDVAYTEGRRAAAVAIWAQHLPPASLIYKSQTMLALGDRQRAIALVARVPGRRFPQPVGGRLAQVLVELGNVHLESGRFVDAEFYWRWAIIQSPERDNYYVGLGRSLAGQQR